MFFQGMISSGITRISVPFLFIISGYLFFAGIKKGSVQEFSDKYKKRVRSLVIPYIFWSVFSILLFLVLQSFPFSKHFFTKGLVRDFGITEWLHTLFVLPIAAQLWFIRDLIVLIALSPILFIVLKKIPGIFLACCFILWAYNFRLHPFSADSLLFFSAGSYLGIKKISLRNLPEVNNSYLLLLSWITILAVKTWLAISYTDVRWAVLLLHKASILLGIAAVWYCYDNLYQGTDISQKKYYALFKYGFWIFATHQPLIHIVKKGLYYLIGVSNLGSFIIYILSIIITLMIVIPIGIFFRKFFPKIYLISTGGR